MSVDAVWNPSRACRCHVTLFTVLCGRYGQAPVEGPRRNSKRDGSVFIVGEGIVLAPTSLRPPGGTQVGWALPLAPPPIFQRAAERAQKNGFPAPLSAQG